ncbi:MAG: tetratricopeptide repeat protein [Woeseia sp.]
MRKFIHELRRREVFRTAGLYVGIWWIVIQAASVLLPAFEMPAWILRALIVMVIAGFPVMLVLAWVYDITDKGVVVGRATDTTVIPVGGRKMDFIAIGVLSVALVFSVYMNFRAAPVVAVEHKPISVLIADFNNETGDPLLDGTLEWPLQIGIERASFVTAYRREAARRLVADVHTADGLDVGGAQLVAAREGINLVLAGSIVSDDGKYELSVRAVEPSNMALVAEADATTADLQDVMTTVALLAGDLRNQLGDDSAQRDESAGSATLAMTSLEAVRWFDRAQDLQYDRNYEDAISSYKKALEYEPALGRAYAGWAVAAHMLDRVDESDKAWEQAVARLDTMTERERLRALGTYYLKVARNYDKAVEHYYALIDEFPADYVGYENLAVSYFLTLDFQNALHAGRAAMDVSPNSRLDRCSFALLAMYASEFDTAVIEANKARGNDRTCYKAWLPLAMHAIADGNLDAARDAYRRMADSGARAASIARLGLADVEIFSGNFVAARKILLDGIADDDEITFDDEMAAKYIALADLLFREGNQDAAFVAAGKALALTSSEASSVPVGLMYAEAGRTDAAMAIVDTLSHRPQPRSRSYATLIEAMLRLRAEKTSQAIKMLTQAAAMADLWLVRLHLGHAYLEGGFYAEALDEFLSVGRRHGEAAAIFLDDLPTYRYVATLPYWIGRAQEELGMAGAATANYSTFIARRPIGGPLADDARRRLQ